MMIGPKPQHVFCGLSATHAQAAALAPGAVLHPPVRRGDIPAVVNSESRAGTIAVIDGVFHSQETLTLTEIRDAAARGWTLLGCSSMGALRALEAAPLGMRGFGVVYRWMRLYAVEDDDEVAQTMNPETCEPLSLAMVDVRWQVAALCRGGTISRAQGREILEAVKARYYPERTRGLLTRLVAERVSGPFALPAGLDAPKRRDALDLLRRLGESGA